MLEISYQKIFQSSPYIFSAMWHLPRKIFDLAIETLSKIRRLKKQRVTVEKKAFNWEINIRTGLYDSWPRVWGKVVTRKAYFSRWIYQKWERGKHSSNCHSHSSVTDWPFPYDLPNSLNICADNPKLYNNCYIIGVARWAIKKSVFTRRLATFHLTQQKQQLPFFFSFIFISWRLITLQYCTGFRYTLTWISHEFTSRSPLPPPSPPDPSGSSQCFLIC